MLLIAEAWRVASRRTAILLARASEPISLVGGLSFCVLVLIGGGLAARYLVATHMPRPIRRADQAQKLAPECMELPVSLCDSEVDA